MVSVNWLVVENTINFEGNSLNFFSLIWLDEKRIEPFFAIKDSQVVRKKELFLGSLKLNLVELNFEPKR